MTTTRTRRTGLAVAGIAAFALIGAACSSSETSTSSGAGATTATTARAGGSTGTTAKAAGDIVAVASSAGDFKTLVQAVQAAGLVSALQAPGPITVFAPTDAAFAKVPAGTLENLLKPENKGQLETILKYHVVSGNVKAADVVKLDGQEIDTLAGEKLKVQVEGEKVFLIDGAGNKIAVVKTDIPASNGTIHVIDGVLLPKA
jgi:uncharacterized surface protein with fasciclin (FAS1) repeats